eukprot:CFRG5816T1
MGGGIFEISSSLSPKDFWAELLSLAKALLDGETDYVCNAANLSSLMWSCLKARNDRLGKVNWVGFYFIRNGGLVLGPFHGLVACTRIKIGKGVCGTSVSLKKNMLVDDVDAFPGHIACDSASKSEIVIPLMDKNGVVFGVLDSDNGVLSGWDEADVQGFESIAKLFAEASDIGSVVQNL